MSKGLTIGDFSQITHLSVKTLRRYHEAGLLEPDAVDAVHRLPLLHHGPDARPRR